MNTDIEAIKSAALQASAAAKNLDDLKEVKVSHVGDRSPIARANQGLGQVPAEERAAMGKIIGTARADINQSFDDREKALTAERDSKVLIEERVDVTLPVNRSMKGALHPLTILSNEISDLFIGMGYTVQEGPEMESSWLTLMLSIFPQTIQREQCKILFL